MKILNSRELSAPEIRALAYSIGEWDESARGEFYEYYLEPVPVYSITLKTLVEMPRKEFCVLKLGVEAQAEADLLGCLRYLSYLGEHQYSQIILKPRRYSSLHLPKW